MNFPLKLVKLGLLGLRCTAPTSVSQSEVEESSDEASSFGAVEAGSSWPRASCTTSKAAKAAVAKTSLLLVAAVQRQVLEFARGPARGEMLNILCLGRRNGEAGGGMCFFRCRKWISEFGREG